MPADTTLIAWLIGWIGIAAVILWLHNRREPQRVGLVLAFIFALWLIHWLGSAIYIFPSYSNFDPDVVLEGLKQSAYAVAAFGVGSVLLAPWVRRISSFPPPVGLARRPATRLAPLYIIFGLIFYLLLAPWLIGPSVTSLIAAGGNLITAGLVLRSWWAWKQKRRGEFLGTMLLAMGLPFLTLITQGFIGYGTVALILVCACVASFYRPRWKVVLVGVLASFLGLSIYVTYMRDRTEVREVIWGGESYSNRLQRLYLTFSEFEFFDINDDSHLFRIDSRLNQSALVGMSVRNLDSGRVDFAGGETITDAALGLVPRVMWPNKPVTGGSGDLVSTYTGLTFAEGTSVGVGQVMEFYINFGTMGVLIGFLIMGTIVGLLDAAAGERMMAGEWGAFILWFLPGVTFLQVGGQLVEVTSSAAAAFFLALIVKRFVLGRPRAVDAHATSIMTRRPSTQLSYSTHESAPRLGPAPLE
jgi:hypothetical protein